MALKCHTRCDSKSVLMTTRIFQNAWFRRFARRENIPLSTLLDAVNRAEQGQVNADLGGGVIKQRIARSGQGKSSGYRTIIVFRQGERAFFVFGFAKSDRDNLAKDELAAFKKTATVLFGLSESQLAALIENGDFTEITP